MAIISTPVGCSMQLSDTDWTSDFLAMIAAEEAARGSKMSLSEKEVEWTKWQHPAVPYTTPNITIGSGTAGSTYEIEGALSAIAVQRNGQVDQYWSFADGVFTFVNPLLDGDIVRFTYNKQAR